MDTQILTAIISGCIFGAVIAWPITRLIYMHKIKMNEMDKDRVLPMINIKELKNGTTNIDSDG
jgi:hypothetical protein